MLKNQLCDLSLDNMCIAFSYSSNGVAENLTKQKGFQVVSFKF